MLTGFDFRGFRNRLDRRKGLKLTISKPGLKVEITAAGNPKQIKHFRESAEKMLRAMSQAK
jgi:hypothetical protein